MQTILLHIHDDNDQDSRLQVAIDMARLEQGHLLCVQAAGVAAFADPYAGLFGLAAIIDTIHDQDKRVRQAIEARLAATGVDWDWRCIDGGTAEALIGQSRLADIIIVSQQMPSIGDLLLHASAPVLAVPPTAARFRADGNVMLAWNGSVEAAHAMRLATPLLRRAACVHVVEVADDHPLSQGIPPGDAAAYLARHGIACERHDWPAKGRRTSTALFHAAAELDAAYLVMGAYGHSRLRETVLGGVTRELLQSAPLPLLLAH